MRRAVSGLALLAVLALLGCDDGGGNPGGDSDADADTDVDTDRDGAC